MCISGYDLKITSLSKTLILENKCDLLSIAEDISEEYWDIQNFILDLPEKWSLSFSIFKTNRPISYAIVSKKSEENAHIHHFMVHKNYRRLNIGKTMIQEVHTRAKTHKYKFITLKTMSNSIDAQRFYTKYGYIQYENDGIFRSFCKNL